MAWVTDTLSAKRMEALEEIDHETMWIMISNKDKQVLIGVSYRQKKGRYAPDYWAKLQSGLDKAIATKISNIMMVGDFNADPDNKTDHDTLLEFLSTNNFTQHVREPTRVTSNSATILDLVITNLPRLVKNVGVSAPVHENDHSTVFGTLNLKTVRRQCFTRDMWNFKNANFDFFREELGNVNWDTCFDIEDISRYTPYLNCFCTQLTSDVIDHVTQGQGQHYVIQGQGRLRPMGLCILHM
jgi:hypothetical protein